MTAGWSVVVPWPDGALSPNARHHWRIVADAKRAARAQWHALALQAGGHLLHKVLSAAVAEGKKIGVHLDFYPPDKRHHDDANLMYRCKAGIDGLADALGIDDRHFKTSYDLLETVAGMVRISVSIKEAA
jgi:crossover junction endodeoxyribonuclease RusA